MIVVVLKRIAGEMIAGIILCTSRAAPGGRLFCRLNPFGAREKASSGNPGGNKGTVIGAAGKVSALVRLLVRLYEVFSSFNRLCALPPIRKN